ncbi:MAG: hypothetical protein ACJAVV_001188 [Alphaproteobacteria bacterium]|jgi:hypothetical protein
MLVSTVIMLAEVLVILQPLKKATENRIMVVSLLQTTKVVFGKTLVTIEKRLLYKVSVIAIS